MEERSVNDITTVETPGSTSSIVKTESDGNDPDLDGQKRYNIQLSPILFNQRKDKGISSVQCNSSNEQGGPQKQSDNDVLFFNYHEFQETYYIEVNSPDDGPKEHDMAHSIVVTHFPNIYVPQGSIEWGTTRIVRIPRSYDQRVTYPCFSEYLPGHEPAAIIAHDEKENDNNNTRFVCRGKSPRDGQWYGSSSVSPLSIYLTQERFQEIVREINRLIGEDFQLGGWRNMVDLILEWFTFGLVDFSKIFYNLSGDKSTKVDKYIKVLNSSDEFVQYGIKIIPLARSGYLSLDFQIPYPTPN